MFFQQLVNGLVMGGAYALISIGLTMIFGIMNFTNLAHGTIYMLGGYAMYMASTLAGMPFFISVGVAILSVGLLGVVIERVIFKSVYNAPELNSLLISLGLMMFLENMAQLVWGTETLNVASPFGETVIRFLGASLTMQRLVVLITSLVLMVVLYFFLNRTSPWEAMRWAGNLVMFWSW